MEFFLVVRKIAVIFVLGASMKHSFILTILFLACLTSLSQTSRDLSMLIGEVSGNSKTIVQTEPGKKLISYGSSLLPLLAELFSDTTLTGVYSECHSKKLTKGEISIVIADVIEMMPYEMLTGLQNCLREYCPGNPNRVEYYLTAIEAMGVSQFSSKYVNWLKSKTRRQWLKDVKKAERD